MSSTVAEVSVEAGQSPRSEIGAPGCPVCAHPCTGEPLYRYTAEQAAAHFCPPVRNADRNRRLRACIRRLWRGTDCVVLECDRCGFAFGWPFVGGDEEFYHILHEQKGYPVWRWDYDFAMAEAVKRFAGGNILDIGAGSGNFLRRLDQSWNCHAVEGSELTRVELEAAGVKVFRDLPEAARHRAGAFQVVTLFQVLEHIADFGPMLKHCRELLAVGGVLVVTVPDGAAMVRQERLTGCHDMPPNHVGKWTPESLALVLKRSGFECSAPVSEPSSWKNLKASLHMRVIADAAAPDSLTAQAYRIRSKPIRIAVLSLLGGPALMRMLPHSRQLRLGGAFGMLGQANGPQAIS